jgi:hypothetical protein
VFDWLGCRVPNGGRKGLPIIGVSASGNLMFATPLGGADYRGNRLRVTDGGQYGKADITLEKVRTTGSAWTRVLTNAGVVSVGQCHVAVQCYNRGQPSGASAQVIGTLNPGMPVTVNIQTQNCGTNPSFWLWSGDSEIKPRIIEGPEW